MLCRVEMNKSLIEYERRLNILCTVKKAKEKIKLKETLKKIIL